MMESASQDGDHTTNHAQSSSSPYAHPSAIPSGQSQQPLDQSYSQQNGQSSSQPKFSNGPHIRSRITVVCAECKRLKLKCDRRTPCSSCLKRDTVQRCVYSQAAAEKIDVQSLHNRILVLEAALTQLSTANPSAPMSAALAGLPPFKAPFPASATSTSFPLNSMSPSSSAQQSLAGLPCNDRALLALGASGSSVIISLEDVASIWLNELEDFNIENKTASAVYTDANHSPVRPGTADGRIKAEPSPALIPASPRTARAAGASSHSGPSPTDFVPPLPYDVYLPSTSYGPASTHITTPSNPFPQANASSSRPLCSEPPQVTTALFDYLPPPTMRPRLLKALEDTMILHPCFNVRHFVQRVDAMFTWSENGGRTLPDGSAEQRSSPVVNGAGAHRSMEDLARDVFFGSANNGKGRSYASQQSSPKPTLSFFAATSAAFALGALVARDEGPQADTPPEGGSAETRRCSPSALYALSEQAFGLFEKTSSYDIDSVVAMILQLLYLLHDGQLSVAQGVFPLVGKMINIARMMGLAVDPDEFPGTYSLFEAETRRRVWWDVFYYDLFISDCMGHPPLIPDNSFTTRLPADVDDENFSPSSTSLPASENEGSESGTAYFVLKCKLAQLVKNVKKQTFRDPLAEDVVDLSIDQVAAYESEVTTWLQDLPPNFRFEMSQEMDESYTAATSGAVHLQAQKCELAILANRLILKLYLPFLKEAGSGGSSKPSHQAVLGTINAAHLVIQASRTLHSVWRQTRPAAFDFYDFGRTLFDAAVICAHAVIQQPTSILASEALRSVGCALDVMRELSSSRAGLEGTRAGDYRHEAIRIVEMMKRKAESARGGSVASAGSKRKRPEAEGEVISSGFQLPFVGVAVASAGQTQSAPTKAAVAQKDSQQAESKKNDKKHSSKDKDKTKYPTLGIRVRPGQGPPTSRQRTGSTSTSRSNGRQQSVARSAAAPPVPHSQPQQMNHVRATMSESPSNINGYRETYSTPGPSGPVREVVQQEDFAMQYGPEDATVMDSRRYGFHAGESSNPAMYEAPSSTGSYHPHNTSQSPTGYSTSPPDYYLHYAAPPSAPQGYDPASLSHPQGMPMVGLTGPAMDPLGSSGTIAPPLPSVRSEQYITHEKSHSSAYSSHMGKPSDRDLPRQPQLEYTPSQPPHSMPPSHAHQQTPHSWGQPQPGPGGEMWSTEFKFYNTLQGG